MDRDDISYIDAYFDESSATLQATANDPAFRRALVIDSGAHRRSVAEWRQGAVCG